MSHPDTTNGNGGPYYQQLAQSPDLFWEKLKAFHKSLGTKFKRTPVVGGRTLDLHQLFVEVTNRGGLEQVIRDRKWKEVIMAFKFPTTITSASFVLRKYYLSVLYHFEQTYYFGNQAPSLANKPDNGSRGVLGGSTNIVFDSSTAQIAEQDLQLGSSVSGVIDGKFDKGYLVTVMLGSEQLQGVLYHMPQNPPVSHGGSNVPGAAPRKRRKKIFFGSHDSSQPKEKGITKVRHIWNNLTDAEKQVYAENTGYKDEELRYRNELSSTCW